MILTDSTSEISTLRARVHAAVQACKIAGGEDCLAFYIQTLNSPTDYMVVCSASSYLQAQGLYRKINDWLFSNNIEIFTPPLRNDNSGWIVIDCGYMIIHIMLRALRSYYDLEHLWFKDSII